jgi:hypothetical protein
VETRRPVAEATGFAAFGVRRADVNIFTVIFLRHLAREQT